MLNTLFVSKYTIQRHQKAPLLQERLKYLKWWYKNGAQRPTLIFIEYHLLIIIKYLKLGSKNIISPLSISRAAKKWAIHRYKRRNAKHKRIRIAERYFIHY